MKNKKIIVSTFLLGLFFIFSGLTYAFFNYTDFSNELVTSNGEVYMKLNKLTSNSTGKDYIELTNVFPETYSQALYQNGISGTLRTDNIIEFSVIGKNTYEEPVYYEIDLEYGDSSNNPSGKTRIDDKYLRFELIDYTDPLYPITILDGENFDSINNKRIHVDTFEENNSEITRNYRLRMWYDEHIIISDTDPLADFKASNNEYQDENQDLTLYTNVFANVRVKVYGDFVEKISETPEACFTVYEYETNKLAITGYDISCGTDVVIPQKINNKPVTRINGFGTSKAQITTVRMKSGITDIQYNSFQYMTNLTYVYIPNTVKTIGRQAFSEDPNLINVVIPNSVTLLEHNAFSYDTSLQKIVLGSGITNLSRTFYGDTSLKKIIIPDSVTSIGMSVFYNCTNLEYVRMSKNVTIIQNEAFRECSKLKEINFPDTLVTIKTSAFYNCSSLEKIVFPDSLTTIESQGFAYNTSLIYLRLSKNLTTIESGAFEHAESLETLVIPNGSTLIGKNMFSCAYSLKSVVIPDSIEVIREYSFMYSGLESVKVPGTVTEIGAGTFDGCTSLTDVYFGWELPIPPYRGELFSGVNKSLITLHVPRGKITAYQQSPYYTFTNIVDDYS